MRTRLRPAPIPAATFVALAVLAGLAVAVLWGARSAPERTLAFMDGWDVPDLVAHLEGRGLKLHLSPTAAGRKANADAYLTTAARPEAELYGLVKDTSTMRPWAGVVYCERLRNPADRQIVLEWWGDCGLQSGHFVLFGDPALLARIRNALGDVASSGTRSGAP
jgi:hypothetical protein